MIRIRSLAIAIAAIFALGVAPFAHAQTIKDTTETGAVTGDITALDLTASTLTVKGPNDDGGTYKVDAYTGIMNGADKVALKDLQKGWRVVVNYDTTSKGKVAKLIEVVVAP
jgi:hypothetical protein